MKTIKKILTGFITACMVFSAGSVTALAADTLSEANSSGSTTVRYVMDSGWKATIPAYINPSEQGNADTEAYSVTVSDVMLGSSATLVGTVEYDGKLVEANDVELGYVLCDADGEIVTNKEIIYADAGNPDAETAYSFGAELNEKPRYAGNYSGTAAFNFAVNERVFTIGETQPENVIAKFNENYSEVDIFTAGNDSDGIMKDFSGNSPMQAQADKLNAASIEGGVTTIGSQAFNACNKLTSVSIPDTVTSIGSDSFEDCGSLNTIYGSYGSAAEEWAENNSFDFVNSIVYMAEDIENDDHLFAIGETKPEYVVAKFNEDFTKLTIFANGEESDGKIAKPKNAYSPFDDYENLTHVDIKSGVVNIKRAYFRECTALTDVIIPESVTSIDEWAFYECTALKNVTILGKIDSIGDKTFYLCSSLENIKIPDSVTSIGEQAFFACKSLSNVELPNNLISIGNSAFQSCSNLANITIPENVTSIGNSAFQSCDNLTNITIPENVTSIGNSAFQTCSNLANIAIPENVTFIGEKAFYRCDALENVIIRSNVNSVSAFAFSECKNLVDVTLLGEIASIGNSAFKECTSLKKITFPNSIMTIDSNAFNNCSSLESILLPNSVTEIGTNAFTRCSSLKDVEIGNSVEKIGSSAFSQCNMLKNIRIPNSVYSIGNYVFLNSPIEFIYGMADSYAETWANSNGYTFVTMD